MDRDVAFELGPDYFADADVPVVGIDTLDDGPGRRCAVGARDDLLGGVDEVVVVFVVAPVLVLDLVAQHRVGRQRLEAFLLRVPAQVHPEFQDQRAVVGQRVLEADDLREPVVELRIVDFAVNALQQRRRVAPAQVHAHAAFRRNVAPVAPESRPRFLLVGRRLVADGPYPARIHPLVEHVHRGALARSVDAGEVDDDGEPRHLERLVLELEEARAQLVFALLELGFRNALSELGGVKHWEGPGMSANR